MRVVPLRQNRLGTTQPQTLTLQSIFNNPFVHFVAHNSSHLILQVSRQWQCTDWSDPRRSNASHHLHFLTAVCTVDPSMGPNLIHSSHEQETHDASCRLHFSDSDVYGHRGKIGLSTPEIEPVPPITPQAHCLPGYACPPYKLEMVLL